VRAIARRTAGRWSSSKPRICVESPADSAKSVVSKGWRQVWQVVHCAGSVRRSVLYWRNWIHRAEPVHPHGATHLEPCRKKVQHIKSWAEGGCNEMAANDILTMGARPRAIRHSILFDFVLTTTLSLSRVVRSMSYALSWLFSIACCFVLFRCNITVSMLSPDSLK
jgi:hypothetical protein